MNENNKNTLEVTAPGAYPPVEVEAVNLNYARILLNDIGSPYSEMTTIYQYLYQSWTLPPAHEELSALTLQIAKVEMHHIQMLGELVAKLGGNPQCRFYKMGRAGYWNGTMAGYPQSLRAAVQLNVTSEKNACQTYETQAAFIKDPCVSAVLRRIAEDEKVHISLWETCMRSLDTDC